MKKRTITPREINIPRIHNRVCNLRSLNKNIVTAAVSAAAPLNINKRKLLPADSSVPAVGIVLMILVPVRKGNLKLRTDAITASSSQSVCLR